MDQNSSSLTRRDTAECPRGMGQRDYSTLRQKGYSDQELRRAQEVIDLLADTRHLDYLDDCSEKKTCQRDEQQEDGLSYAYQPAIDEQMTAEELDMLARFKVLLVNYGLSDCEVERFEVQLRRGCANAGRNEPDSGRLEVDAASRDERRNYQVDWIWLNGHPHIFQTGAALTNTEAKLLQAALNMVEKECGGRHSDSLNTPKVFVPGGFFHSTLAAVVDEIAAALGEEPHNGEPTPGKVLRDFIRAAQCGVDPGAPS